MRGAILALSLLAIGCAPPDYELPSDRMPSITLGHIEYGAVDHVMAWIDAQDAPEIAIVINSGGGFADPGLELIARIKGSKATVYCVVDGGALSMAFVILQSCHVRVMTDRSFLMAHEAYLKKPIGTPAEDAAFLRRFNDYLAVISTGRLSMTPAEFSAKIANGFKWWIKPDEALAIGAVDVVVNH